MKSRPKVILVDDDKDVANVFSEFLKINGVVVKGIGHDGKQAVELYLEHMPDVVILDLLMPNYDGFYAFEHIKKEDKDAKIVILTADTKPKHLEMLKKLGPLKIVAKPYDAYEMLEIINSVKKA
jgi:two-component system chemotaxis response regulator CheY